MGAESMNVISSAELEKKYGKPESELFAVAEYHSENAERIGYSQYSYWKSVWQNFIKKKSVKVMSAIFIALVIFSFVATRIGKYDFATLHSSLMDQFTRPNSEYWFGTDNLGRDYWVQVWGATQTSIKLSGMVAIGECVLGVIIGCLWGYVRRLETILTELYNIINNVPMIIYMTLIAMFIGQSLFVLTVSLIAFGWLRSARQVRSLVLIFRDREYNLASRCLGTKVGTVLTRNIIPYLVSVIFLQFSTSIPSTIATETTLSYLGLGLGVDTPSLGILLRNARGYFMAYPYLLVFPAVIVALITISFYVIGNAFSDACDPRNHV